MNFKSEKGQAFSVFKLLIAAVVAIVILTILLQVLSGIGTFQQGKPSEQAATKVSSLVNSLGIPEKTQTVTWENGDTLFSRNIADSTGTIGEDQVCVLMGDVPASRFDLDNEGTIIRYTGTSGLATKLQVLCDHEELIGDTVGLYQYEWDLDNCNFDPNSDSQRTVCVVVVVENV
ncbi:MAG: hypothetical protein ABH854_00035 [Candidatus Diapherotrites archaeon]